MLVLAEFCALAVKSNVAPSCRDALVGGLSEIFAGKGEAPGGLLLPQAGRKAKIAMVMINQNR